MSLKWYHRFGLRAIDLLILVVFLVIVTTTALTTGDFALLSIDFATLLLVIVGVYVGVVLFVEFLLLGFQGESIFHRFAKATVTGLLIFFLFPYLVSLIMWIVGRAITADIQLMLMVVAVLRTIVRALLSKQWGSVP